MTTTYQDNLLDWLRDAHAMEQQAETLLRAQSSRLENYPVLKSRIDQHLEETLGQQRLLEGALTQAGGDTSLLKDLAGKAMALGQGLVGMTMTDEVVKGAMSGYVFENVEIASYTVLIAAAESAGDVRTRGVCEQILKQEVAMAQWLLDHLPELTQAFLARDATPGLTARR
ncbi:MAG: DUF892 family protein [Candidatus Dactylopiibacterium sp.]|nr:DUF892 family protein [Candidatus Dactylopiibacterium sp.]